jgi:hypothetical protein
MTVPAVSVLMTTFNREAFVGAAIESVLQQRFTDFELLVVDDASSDGTASAAREYERLDDRVRVVVNERNLGQFANRNRAAALARGRLLKYHDSDDVMYPHCLDVMVAALEAQPLAGLAMTASRAWHGTPVPQLVSPRQAYEREFLGFGMFMGGPATALFRREAFAAIGGFSERGVHADYLFWLAACARHAVVLVNADLFWYREHPGQALRSAAAGRDYAEVDGEVWRVLHSEQCPLEGESLAQARRNHAWNVAKHLWRDARRGDWRLVRHRVRHSRMSLRDWCVYLRKPRRSMFAGVAGEHVCV